ncbi:hypothetical protein CBS101457_006897 [Exobasidium rhododendri]|nr:hypothetical protein CBS101457_006897 [Exobasidium rhododendri]
MAEKEIQETMTLEKEGPSVVSNEAFDGLNEDERMLASLGYKQEFKREFSTLTTICYCTSVMGVVASFSATLNFPLDAAGHVGIVWAWAVGSVMVWSCAASLAEMSSAMPTSGGLYYFSARLASPRWAPLACWWTGWMNVTGQVALVSSITYTAAQFIYAAAIVGNDFSEDFLLSAGELYAIFLGLLLFLGVLCSCATKILANLNILYLVLNIGSALAVIIGLAATGPHVSAKVAFTQLENGSGWSNNGMAFLLSLTSVMWTHTGYDSAVHVAEETKNAAKTAPLAIMSAVFGTSFMGFALAIVTSFAVSDLQGAATSTLGVPMAQILYDHLGKRGMLALWSFIIVVQVNTAAAQLVDASRVVFAFSRDGALPGSRYWSRINKHTQTPVFAVFFVVLGAALLGLLTLQLAAGLALFSCAVIALYISYAIPIFLRLMTPDFQRGPWHLGKFSRPIAAIAVAWVSFITIVLLFPLDLNPGIVNMNWAILILGVITLGSLTWWLVDAHKWFTGPIRTIQDHEKENSSM